MGLVITCQPGHTLRMAREVILSISLLVSFLYFLAVVYIFYTDAECNEVTEVWCHVISISALMSFISIYCTRWGVQQDQLDPKQSGWLMVAAFWSPAFIFTLGFYGSQFFFLVWINLAAGQATYRGETDSCKGMVDTAFSGLVTCLIFASGLVPGLLLVQGILLRYFPEVLNSDIFLAGDPTRPDTPPPQVELRVTQHGVREVVVHKKREKSEREKLREKKRQIRDMARKAELEMLKHFHAADIENPDRAMTLREARQMKAAATNKESRAMAAAYLAKKNFKKEEKAMLRRIEAERKEKEKKLKNAMATGGGSGGDGGDRISAAVRRRQDAMDEFSDDEGDSKGGNPWRDRVLKAQKVHTRRSAVLTATSATHELHMAKADDATDEQVEQMFTAGIGHASSRAKQTFAFKSFTKGDSGRPKAWRVGSYYAAVDV